MTAPGSNDATARRAGADLRFVNRRSDAPEHSPDDVVVLDAAWTPGPGSADNVVPIRPTLTAVLDAENLFLTSIARLDPWADACGLVDRFTRDGVTWWFHARSFLRLDLQEMMLWGRVLDRLAQPTSYGAIVVPRDRPLLVAAIRAHPDAAGVEIRLESGSAYRSSDVSGKPALGPARRDDARRVPVRLAARRHAQRMAVALRLRPSPIDRKAALLERLDHLAAHPGCVLAVVRARSFHPVESDGRLIHQDPYLGPVLQRLVAAGRPVASVGVLMGHQKAAHWQLVELDQRLLPASVLPLLPGAPSAADASLLVTEAATRLATIPTVAIPDGARDLGPSLTGTVAALGHWLGNQWLEMDQAGALLDVLRPAALLTGWEAARTAWLGAARRRGIRVIATQHGVIYPSTPDYCRPAHRALVRPDVTCVYGPYEQDILTGQGGYAAHEVVVTGSPRVDPDRIEGPLPLQERSAVRTDLGVAAGDRMLVISGGRMTVGDRLGTLPLLARVLDGPLPGVHLVVKLHPEERDGSHYEELFFGMATAGGYAMPRLTIVRDIDLYRLLRAADAHLGVLSTVLTDSVLAGTPNMIVVGQAQADLIGYVDAGVASPVRSVDDVRAFMVDPRRPSDEQRQLFVADHYLGGDAVSRVVGLLPEASSSVASAPAVDRA